jgi:hypothetical protein
LASARNSQDVWDLRCEIREKLIAFLQETYPDALPKQRMEVERLDAGDADLAGPGRSEPKSFAKAAQRSHR